MARYNGCSGFVLSSTTVDNSLLILKERYEIERELGRGGMSVVYLAKDRQLLSKRVVVKILLEETSQDPWVRQKFLQEMEALARIDHPGVVGALDTGETPDGKQFLVMQYVEGVTLRQALEAGPLPLERAANLIRQIGQALGAAHDKGVWHRDLKPENIMLQSPAGGEEYIRLIDFGIAGIKDSSFGGEATKVAGSASYMAPEQYAGNASAASDIYALSVIAYEMLTGRRPFSPHSVMHLVEDKAHPLSPRGLRPDLPQAAERSILRAMKFQPEARQAAVREFTEELAEALVAGAVAPQVRSEKGKLVTAHVLFLDVVGYSLLPNEQQKDYLEQLQQIVRGAPSFRKAEENRDLVKLPTGDGMALAFFSDPTAPAQCAFEVAAALQGQPHLKLRMGIHSGPVYRVADVNANTNVAGGGMNVAQRVMDSGDAGHILVSKTSADLLLAFSHWAPYLVDLGEHQVKHGVRVHLYNLVSKELGNKSRPRKLGGTSPAAGRRMAVIVALLLAIAAAGFFVWRRMLPPPAEPLQLNYSITVQRWRDGKAYGNPFRLPGEIVFEQDYRIALEVSSPQPGYLYILNEGVVGATGRHSFNLLEPRRDGSAERAPSTTVRIPPAGAWFRFDGAAGTETLYLVWSRAAAPELERVKGLLVDDAAEVKAIENFLALHRRGKLVVQKNEQSRQTEVRTPASVLVHAVALEHQ
jgi:serine/threonine protein kinase